MMGGFKAKTAKLFFMSLTANSETRGLSTFVVKSGRNCWGQTSGGETGGVGLYIFEKSGRVIAIKKKSGDFQGGQLRIHIGVDGTWGREEGSHYL